MRNGKVKVAGNIVGFRLGSIELKVGRPKLPAGDFAYIWRFREHCVEVLATAAADCTTWVNLNA